jgi:hypothetical protein
MPWTSKHLKWFVKIGSVKTIDGKDINLFELRHQNDEAVLSAWAKHFRNHYCLDTEIDRLIQGTGLTRAEYLNQIKFPDSKVAPGPSIRSGDFSEVLVADYLEYILKYWVPRTRYCNKDVRNESTKGCDVIGFRVSKKDTDSAEDTLMVFEVKAQLSGNTPTPRLKEAIEGSIKDITRKSEALNAIKQRFIDKNQTDCVWRIERFQNPADHPYQEYFGAAALFSSTCYDLASIVQTAANKHPNKKDLHLIVIHGNKMLDLVHELYRRAANEA